MALLRPVLIEPTTSLATLAASVLMVVSSRYVAIVTGVDHFDQVDALLAP